MGASLRVAVIVGVLSLPPSHAVTQTPRDLADACEANSGDPARCVAASVFARSLVGHVGLAGGLGSPVPGTASVLGQRVGGVRLALSARAAALRAGSPDLSDPFGLAEASFTIPVVDVGVVVGLFDGFRLLPTVGGFLSVDLFGSADFVFLPQSEGFAGTTRSYSIGGRVGLFRESFTLPGVSVSAARRFIGDVGLHVAAPVTSVTVDPSVTSFRATVGKDLFAFEVMAGVGWDEYSSDASVDFGGFGGGAASGPLDASRRLYFVSLARSYNIVLNLSVEGGWAQGFDPVAGYNGVAYDPTSGTPFGSVALRFTH